MRITPDDDRDFLYPLGFIRAGTAGTVRVRLYDANRTVTAITVIAGETIHMPVARVFATGTTATGLSTGQFGPFGNADEAEVPLVPDLSPPPPPPPPPSFPAPVALYRLDGNGLDASGNGNDLTMTDPVYVPGRFGQALDGGSGSSGNVFNPAATWNDTLSVSLWLKPANAGPETVVGIAGAEGSAIVIQASASQLVVSVADFQDGTTAPLTAGVYVHVCVVVNAGQVLVYVGGEYQSGVDASVGYNDFAPTGGIEILGNNLGVDDVVVSPVVFTPEQIAYLAAGNRHPAGD